jgi:hypothetical protein
MTAYPIGGPYATLAQLKASIGIPDSNTTRDTELTRKLSSAATDINRWCHRQFGQGGTSTRTFRADRTGVDVNDFWTADELDIVPVLSGVAGTAWDVDSVDLLPSDGIMDGVPGWPYNRIEVFGAELATHPLVGALTYRGLRLRVTAKWGWENTPENVTTANIMLAVGDDKAKDAPFGVAGFGDYAVRIRQNAMVAEKLAPYMIDELQVVG